MGLHVGTPGQCRYVVVPPFGVPRVQRQFEEFVLGLLPEAIVDA